MKRWTCGVLGCVSVVYIHRSKIWGSGGSDGMRDPRKIENPVITIVIILITNIRIFFRKSTQWSKFRNRRLEKKNSEISSACSSFYFTLFSRLQYCWWISAPLFRFNRMFLVVMDVRFKIVYRSLRSLYGWKNTHTNCHNIDLRNVMTMDRCWRLIVLQTFHFQWQIHSQHFSITGST